MQFGLWVYPQIRQICRYSASRQIILLPKQKDIKSFFLLSFGAPKETKALAEIIASALL
jgi:hypothetical protein